MQSNESGDFSCWRFSDLRDVRLESGMRSKAEVRQRP